VSMFICVCARSECVLCVDVMRDVLSVDVSSTLDIQQTGWLVMGWLRSVGLIKLYVSFAEYCLFCRALLQKRPIV